MSNPEQLTPLQQALFGLKTLRARLEAIEAARREPIAIIGVGCRFPGATGRDAFWRLLHDGVDAITEVPPGRWDVDTYYDPDPDKPGKIATRYGGFLNPIDQFDAGFFGIAPREALSLDPQQRLLLEVAWEALEDGGQAPEKLSGTATGVFVGISSFDYSLLMGGEGVDAYYGTGNALSAAAGRLSYVLGAQGPSMSMDTACSSSLVAVHLACQSLRNGESTMALAGGVGLLLSPIPHMTFSRARMLAPDGRCKTFDAAANGYVRSEGCGVVVLKRLSDAQAAGDRILAVIRASAVNQDGPSGGLTVPNGRAQEALIRQALASGEVEPQQVGYIEAHGTGTALGDPIEIRALLATLGTDRPADRPLLVGSVKTNIGHLEAAAGIAGLIKVVLALEHEEIPPHLHFQQPNPYIEWSEALKVPTAPLAWPAGGERRLAGVSSFGFTGTNAHVILEEAPAVETAAGTDRSRLRPVYLLALSAKSETAVKELAERFNGHLESHPQEAFTDVCFTATTGRSHWAHRVAIVAADREEARRRLAGFVEGTGLESVEGVVRGKADLAMPAKVAFLFTGQGAQYARMGRQLYETEPVFRRTLEQCDEILRPQLTPSLLSVIYAEPGAEGLLDETAYTQPALFAFEYALAELWRSWGVEPDAVMGHSVGEYVAACVAGVFRLEDGLRLIARRAELMQSLPRGGRMAAVFAPHQRVAAAMDRYADRVAIAAVNGPEHFVLSGQGEAVEAIVEELTAEDIHTQWLTVSHAFHSPLMDPILERFEQTAATITYARPRLRLVSNRTGRVFKGDERPAAGYWRQHLREAVQFAAGMEALEQQGCDTFVEIGPHPTLIGMGRRCITQGQGTWVPSMRRGREDCTQMLESLAALYVRGVAIDWNAFHGNQPHRKLSLPTYPFQRERFWGTRGQTPRPLSTAHPLLGNRLRSALKDVQFEVDLAQDSLSYLRDHRVYGTSIVPAAAFFEMALASARAVLNARSYCLKDVVIHEPLIIGEDDPSIAQLVVSPSGPEEHTFQLFSTRQVANDEESRWTQHAGGRLVPDKSDAIEGALEEALARCAEPLSALEYYRQLEERGLQYGDAFRGIDQLWKGNREAVGLLRLPESVEPDPRYVVHPALLDSCLQLLAAAMPGAGLQDRLFLPVMLESIRIRRSGLTRLWGHVQIRPDERANTRTADLWLFDEAFKPVAELNGLILRQVSRDEMLRSNAEKADDCLYEVAWRSRPRTATPAPPQSVPGTPAACWVVFADHLGVGETLRELLIVGGEDSIIVLPSEEEEVSEREGRWYLNPACPTHFQKLLGTVLQNPDRHCRGIVHMWSLNAIPEKAMLADEITASQLETAQIRICGSTLSLLQTLATAAQPKPRLCLVTQGGQPLDLAGAVSSSADIAKFASPASSSLWGLGKVVALEHPELQCLRIDLDPSALTVQQHADNLYRELIGNDTEDEIAFRGSQRYVSRLVRRSTTRQSAGPVRLEISKRGVLENLALRPSTRRSPEADEVEIEVRATGLNFRDVLNALDSLPVPIGVFGYECAGLISAVGSNVHQFKPGDAVLALAADSFASFVTTPAALVARKPERLTFEEAATIPVAFLTAHRALYELARIKPGERILIHAAAGGVGLAAVQLAQRAGAEIFATAGSPAKRQVLQSLGIAHVLDSRSLDFADEIMARTSGQGVDVVLNSLAGRFIRKSLGVLNANGRFVEIGLENIESEAARLKPGVSYFFLDLLGQCREDPAAAGRALHDLTEDLNRGALQPLPQQLFEIQDVRSAFRHMAQARHIGKVVISHKRDAGPAENPVAIRSHATYLITGAFGGLGLAVAAWLVEQGARHLVLMGRHDPSSSAAAILDDLARAGARFMVERGDVAETADVERIMARIHSSMPPLLGIVHAAGILDDGILVNQTWERFASVLRPKIAGAWNLHKATQARNLDFFVLFSSVVSVLGSPGQANHAAANAFLDGLAHFRRLRQLPASSINWGPWSDIGAAARSDVTSQITLRGMVPFTPRGGLRLLDRLLDLNPTQVTAVSVDWTRFSERFGVYSQAPFLSEVIRAGQKSSTERNALQERLKDAPAGQRHALVLAYLCEQAAHVLGFASPESIDPKRPLNELGLDSLMAVELRNTLGMALGQNLPATLLFNYPSLDALAGYLSRDVLGLEPQPEAEPEATAADDERQASVTMLEQLSDEEVEALLTRKLDVLDEQKVR